MRLLALAALALTAQAATITTTGQGFTLGPITFSNMQYVSTATGPLPLMDFTLVPDPVYPDKDYPAFGGGLAPVMVFIQGAFGLDSTATAESSREFITADFTVQGGYQLGGISVIPFMQDDGPGTSENFALTNPCNANASPSQSGGCIPGSPLQSGTFSASLVMTSGPCAACRDHGLIGQTSLFLHVQAAPAPEPGTWLLVGLALTARLRLVTRRS